MLLLSQSDFYTHTFIFVQPGQKLCKSLALENTDFKNIQRRLPLDSDSMGQIGGSAGKGVLVEG